MNAEEQLKLEKQIIDLPEDFWDLEAPPSTFRQIFDSIVYYGLVIAAVFQVICFSLYLDNISVWVVNSILSRTFVDNINRPARFFLILFLTLLNIL